MLTQLFVNVNDLKSISSTKWGKEGQKNRKNMEVLRPCLTHLSADKCCQKSMKEMH